MKEQNQRQIQNQTELDERRLRQKKLVRKRKIVLSVMLLTSFLLGCVCGRYFPEIKLGKTEEVLASAQDNSGEEKKENQITNNVDMERKKRNSLLQKLSKNRQTAKKRMIRLRRFHRLCYQNR